MKKLLQASIVVVLVLVFLQAMLGGAFPAAGNALTNGFQSHSAAPTSLQSAWIITCWNGRVGGCVTPNVGWNS